MDWQKLNHAYGNASDIPQLLSKLSAYPDETNYEEEPWFSLWSSLYHQGTIYSASFATVPEIVKLILLAPECVTPSFFNLPTSIEIVRKKQNIEIPIELLASYKAAISELGKCALVCIAHNRDDEFARAATAAFAISAGQVEYAEMLLEIASEEVEETLEWYFSR
ncbi:MAG: hypothetical protein IPG64_25480 [Haliea sp.]|nr:hypothetical protein [Haliea sp.]MBK6740956.1 hypothetical protein [Haliea sp.]